MSDKISNLGLAKEQDVTFELDQEYERNFPCGVCGATVTFESVGKIDGGLLWRITCGCGFSFSKIDPNPALVTLVKSPEVKEDLEQILKSSNVEELKSMLRILEHFDVEMWKEDLEENGLTVAPYAIEETIDVLLNEICLRSEIKE